MFSNYLFIELCDLTLTPIFIYSTATKTVHTQKYCTNVVPIVVTQILHEIRYDKALPKPKTIWTNICYQVDFTKK